MRPLNAAGLALPAPALAALRGAGPVPGNGFPTTRAAGT